MQGRRHEFEGGGGSMPWKVGVSTIKTLKFKKGGGCITSQLLWWRRHWVRGYLHLAGSPHPHNQHLI